MRYGLGLMFSTLTASMMLAGQAGATTVIVPNNRATTTSTNNSNSPFGNNSSTGFVLQIDYAAAQLLTVPTGALIDAIGFRLYSNSGTLTQTLDYPTFNIQIGQATSSIANLSRRFATNEGSDTITARSGALSIAANTFIGNKRVNPFYMINFNTPYAYQGGDLLITIQDTLAANAQSTFVSLDAVTPSASIGDVGATSYGAATGTANFFYAPVTELDFVVAAVPEPASWTVLMAGFGLVYGLRFRRVAATAP